MVKKVIKGILDGAPRLICMLPYESGMRLFEGLGLRVKDLDFGIAPEPLP
jgi:integrase